MGKDLGLGCPHVRRGHPGEDGGSGEGEKAEEGRLGLGFGSVCYPSFLSSLFFLFPEFFISFSNFFFSPPGLQYQSEYFANIFFIANRGSLIRGTGKAVPPVLRCPPWAIRLEFPGFAEGDTRHQEGCQRGVAAGMDFAEAKVSPGRIGPR